MFFRGTGLPLKVAEYIYTSKDDNKGTGILKRALVDIIKGSCKIRDFDKNSIASEATESRRPLRQCTSNISNYG